MSQINVNTITDEAGTGPVTVTNGLNVSSGNVGIGTTSPSFEGGTGTGLEINNSSGNGAHVKLTDAASGSGGTNGFDLYAFNTSGYIENYEAGSIVFRNGGTERMRILSTGGITFNGDTAAANALDDYEEGTWTPNQGSGLSVGGTFVAIGRYTKVGNLVTVCGTLDGSSVNVSAVGVVCTNLPFSSAGTATVGVLTGAWTSTNSATLIPLAAPTTLYSAQPVNGATNLCFTHTYRV